MYVCLCIFYLLNCFKIMSVCKSKEKWKSQIFFELFFLKMGTSPKSSVFATVGSRTSTQQRGSATGYYNGDHNREAQRGKQNGKQQRKVKKHVCIFHLLNCFKIMSVCKSKGKMKITHFFWTIFMKMGTSPKSSVFATVGSRTSTQQRGSATG